VTWVGRGARFTLGAATVVGAIALAISASGVLVLVLVAIILAAGLEPLIAWVRGRLRLGRGLTILLVYGAFFLAVIALAAVVLPAAIAQFADAVGRLPQFLDRVGAWAGTLRPPLVSSAVGRLVQAGREVVDARGPLLPSTDAVVGVGLTVVETVVSVVTILAVVYYWLVEHARLQRFALAFLPAPRRAGIRDTWNEVETRLGLWVRGQLILMGTIGLATGTACLLLGVPGWLFLGLISALTEAIPLVGPFLGAIPAVLMGATVSPELALAVAATYLVLQLIEGNVLVPVVMRNSVGISPLLVILSLLVGGAVGGLIGAFLAVPVAAACELIAEGLQAREEPVAQDPVAVDSDADADAEDGPEPGPARPADPPPVDPLTPPGRVLGAEPGLRGR